MAGAVDADREAELREQVMLEELALKRRKEEADMLSQIEASKAPAGEGSSWWGKLFA